MFVMFNETYVTCSLVILLCYLDRVFFKEVLSDIKKKEENLTSCVSKNLSLSDKMNNQT